MAEKARLPALQKSATKGEGQSKGRALLHITARLLHHRDAGNGDDNVPGWYNNAMTMMIPKATGGYDYYYYASDGWDDANETEYAGWCDEYGDIQKNVTIPVTTSIWFKNDAAATVTFSK